MPTEGSCTQTAGILSYREIQQIRQDTGGTAYLDKEAAVRYMVYDSDSWVSYDDETTSQMKIDYANKMGLGGLMVWAIDLDDGSLSALSAISAVNSTDSGFDLVPLEYLFPPDILPANDSKPSWGLITLGDKTSLEPNEGGFGFMLVAGDSHAVSNLRKRDGEPEPFYFLPGLPIRDFERLEITGPYRTCGLPERGYCRLLPSYGEGTRRHHCHNA